MARDTLSLVCCAGLFLAGAALVLAGPDDTTDKITTTLRVQNALGKGRESLKSGHFREAVDALERELALIEGNLDYLKALREGYQGLISELRQKNQPDEANRYRRRLESLDPGALLELKTSAPTSPTPTPTPPSTPPPMPVAERTPARPEIDPFSDANHIAMPQALALLEQAEAAFRIRKYAEAGQLYEQASRPDAATVAPARARWAYCKLLVVGLQLGDPQAKPKDMEREVRLALSMAPMLNPAGQGLLEKIQKRRDQTGSEQAAEPLTGNKVRHLPEQSKGWSVAESTNFRILHKGSAELAERVARAAEAARVASARKWFGEVSPSWATSCDIYLHINREEYSRLTGKPADCPGHSTMEADRSGRIVKRCIDLHVDDPNMIGGVVPHETTHVVLADRFDKPLPRWADEGMAVLSEPRDRVEQHLRNLPRHQRERQLFAVSDLMQFLDYPEGRYIGPFYAQSVSLVDYLCKINGPQDFTKFMQDGMKGGFEPALRQHYGLRSFAELQQRWQTATLGKGAPAVAVSKQ